MVSAASVRSSDRASLSTYQKWLQLRTRLSARLWTTFAVVSVLVFAVRFAWLLPNGIERGQTPGELFKFRSRINKSLLWVHLAAILPSAVLAATQFVPRIRARAMSFHRYTGRVINVLTFVSTFSAWGVARVSFGGDLAIQAGTYCLGLMTLWSTVKSWTAIRRLQIDEHREWIIRAWSYQISVITLRLIMTLLMMFMTATGGWYYALTCDEVAYVLRDQELYAQEYPQCLSGWTGPRIGHVSIEANLADTTGLGLTAASRLAFGTSIWTALWIHSIATEYYLTKTKDESNRLREVSTKRQNLRQALKERKDS